MAGPQKTLFNLASMLARRMTVRVRDALSPFGLHPAQFTALGEIADREGLTQAELVARLELEQPGVARTLAGLEEAGWIERSALGRGRAQGLYLTERARLVLPEAAACVAAADAEALAALGRSEAAWLLDDLDLLAARLR